MDIIAREDLETRLQRTAEKMRQAHFRQDLPLVYLCEQVALKAEEFILEFKDGSRWVAVNQEAQPGYRIIREL